MIENLTVYEKAVTTDRPAEMLAKKHGFESLAQLAEALPQGARVLDVGAGASPFGKEVAKLRPDITWINFDYSYHDPAILQDVTRDAPANVEHIAGNATKLDEVYGHGTFDAVFSYWLFPHLSIDDPKPAQDTAKAIFKVTKQGGLISIGPKVNQKRLPSLISGKAIQLVKNEALSAESYADEIVRRTKLPKVARELQKFSNEVLTPFFGTSRYTKGGLIIRRFYDPKSGEYVLPLTPKHVLLMARLAIAMTRHINK
jgi:ubiquinone/menaquinone biosynthesis C-methylase UbiE